MRVEVYYNLHKKVFSIRSCKTVLVVEHATNVCIDNAEFVVRQSGREQVLREKRKNVHAFVRGDWVKCTQKLTGKVATYNPYKYKSFVNAVTEEPLRKAQSVHLFKVDKPTILYT